MKPVASVCGQPLRLSRTRSQTQDECPTGPAEQRSVSSAEECACDGARLRPARVCRGEAQHPSGPGSSPWTRLVVRLCALPRSDMTSGVISGFGIDGRLGESIDPRAFSIGPAFPGRSGGWDGSVAQLAEPLTPNQRDACSSRVRSGGWYSRRGGRAGELG